MPGVAHGPAADHRRRCLAAEPARRTQEEGASTDGIYVERVLGSVDGGASITLGASAIADVQKLLTGRIAVGNKAFVARRDHPSCSSRGRRLAGLATGRP